MISDGTNSGDKMDINRKSLLEQDGKKVSKHFSVVEKHTNKLPMCVFLPQKSVLKPFSVVEKHT